MPLFTRTSAHGRPLTFHISAAPQVRGSHAGKRCHSTRRARLGTSSAPTRLSFKSSGDRPAKEEDSGAQRISVAQLRPGASKAAPGPTAVIFDVLMAQDVDRFVHFDGHHCLNRTLRNGLVRATLIRRFNSRCMCGPRMNFHSNCCTHKHLELTIDIPPYASISCGRLPWTQLLQPKGQQPTPVSSLRRLSCRHQNRLNLASKSAPSASAESQVLATPLPILPLHHVTIVASAAWHARFAPP